MAINSHKNNFYMVISFYYFMIYCLATSKNVEAASKLELCIHYMFSVILALVSMAVSLTLRG